jgi:hypothetical protein
MALPEESLSLQVVPVLPTDRGGQLLLAALFGSLAALLDLSFRRSGWQGFLPQFTVRGTDGRTNRSTGGSLGIVTQPSGLTAFNTTNIS